MTIFDYTVSANIQATTPFNSGDAFVFALNNFGIVPLLVSDTIYLSSVSSSVGQADITSGGNNNIFSNGYILNNTLVANFTLSKLYVQLTIGVDINSIISYDTVIYSNTRSGVGLSDTACFSYSTLLYLQKLISTPVIIFKSPRHNKKMYKCSYNNISIEFTYDHPFVYKNNIITFEQLIKIHPNIKDIEEIPNDQLENIYNIIGHIDQEHKLNIFQIDNNLQMLGGYYKGDKWIDLYKSVQIVKNMAIYDLNYTINYMKKYEIENLVNDDLENEYEYYIKI